jgi:transcriptional regulator with XRE-family HTH domain
MDKKLVIKKVRSLLKAKGIRLTKFGEMLGSKGGQQAKIDRANRFIRGYQKSVSLDEIKKLAKFFNKPESYFLQSQDSLFSEKKKNPYVRMSLLKIEKFSDHELDKFLFEIQERYPHAFKGVKVEKLENKIKRVILKVFYCGFE